MVKEAAKSTPCVAYYRVSTRAQGESGLGLEAQQKAVLDYLKANSLDLLDEYTEVETGKKVDRPELDLGWLVHCLKPQLKSTCTGRCL